MNNTNMLTNDKLRPTHSKENKDIILKKIAEDVKLHNANIAKIKKEQHQAILLLRPNGKELVKLEEVYNKEIGVVEKEIAVLTKEFKQEIIKTKMPIYQYNKAKKLLIEEHEKTLNEIEGDIKKRKRSLISRTINMPLAVYEKEVKDVVRKHKEQRKSIKGNRDLGKISLKEELDYLEEKHLAVLETIKEKHQSGIDEAESKRLEKADIKGDLKALNLEFKTRTAEEKETYKVKLNEIIKPDVKAINNDVKVLKAEFKAAKAIKAEKIKEIELKKKAAVAEEIAKGPLNEKEQEIAVLKQKLADLTIKYERSLAKVNLTDKEQAVKLTNDFKTNKKELEGKIKELEKTNSSEIRLKTKEINHKAKFNIIKEKNEIKKIKGFRPRKLTYNRRKILWGIVFAAPWIIGFVLLFAFPFFQSIYYSFFKLTPVPGDIILEFVGFDNYIYAFQEHVIDQTSFKIELLNTLQNAAINLPVLLIFSLFIAVLLNHDFRGRAVIRAIFFIPVILNSSAVTIALSEGGTLTQLLLDESSVTIFDLGKYLQGMGIGTTAVAFVVGLIGRIYTILTLAGVPILLFLAAIQSVPKHLYEAATIEGATGYEQFWLITLPNVSPHIITVSIYAIVDTFLTSSVATIITNEYNKVGGWGTSAAMSWIYVISIIGLLLVLAILAKIFKIGESHYEREK